MGTGETGQAGGEQSLRNCMERAGEKEEKGKEEEKEEKEKEEDAHLGGVADVFICAWPTHQHICWKTEKPSLQVAEQFTPRLFCHLGVGLWNQEGKSALQWGTPHGDSLWTGTCSCWIGRGRKAGERCQTIDLQLV